MSPLLLYWGSLRVELLFTGPFLSLSYLFFTLLLRFYWHPFFKAVSLPPSTNHGIFPFRIWLVNSSCLPFQFFPPFRLILLQIQLGLNTSLTISLNGKKMAHWISKFSQIVTISVMEQAEGLKDLTTKSSLLPPPLSFWSLGSDLQIQMPLGYG